MIRHCSLDPRPGLERPVRYKITGHRLETREIHPGCLDTCPVLLEQLTGSENVSNPQVLTQL